MTEKDIHAKLKKYRIKVTHHFLIFFIAIFIINFLAKTYLFDDPTQGLHMLTFGFVVITVYVVMLNVFYLFEKILLEYVVNEKGDENE